MASSPLAMTIPTTLSIVMLIADDQVPGYDVRECKLDQNLYLQNENKEGREE